MLVNQNQQIPATFKILIGEVLFTENSEKQFSGLLKSLNAIEFPKQFDSQSRTALSLFCGLQSALQKSLFKEAENTHFGEREDSYSSDSFHDQQRVEIGTSQSDSNRTATHFLPVTSPAAKIYFSAS